MSGVYHIWKTFCEKPCWKEEWPHLTRRVLAFNVPIGHFEEKPRVWGDCANTTSAVLIRLFGRIVCDARTDAEVAEAVAAAGGPAAAAAVGVGSGQSGTSHSKYYMNGTQTPRTLQYVEELMSKLHDQIVGYRFWIVILDGGIDVVSRIREILAENSSREEKTRIMRESRNLNQSRAADAHQKEFAHESGRLSGGMTHAPDRTLRLDDQVVSVFRAYLVNPLHAAEDFDSLMANQPLSAKGDFSPYEIFGEENCFSVNLFNVCDQQRDPANYFPVEPGAPSNVELGFGRWGIHFPENVNVSRIVTPYFNPQFMCGLPLPNVMRSRLEPIDDRMQQFNKMLIGHKHQLAELGEYSDDPHAKQRILDEMRLCNSALAQASEEMASAFHLILSEAPSSAMAAGGVSDSMSSAYIDDVVKKRNVFRRLNDAFTERYAILRERFEAEDAASKAANAVRKAERAKETRLSDAEIERKANIAADHVRATADSDEEDVEVAAAKAANSVRAKERAKGLPLSEADIERKAAVAAGRARALAMGNDEDSPVALQAAQMPPPKEGERITVDGLDWYEAMTDMRRRMLEQFYVVFKTSEDVTTTVNAARTWYARRLESMGSSGCWTRHFTVAENLSPFGNMIYRMTTDFADSFAIETNFRLMHLSLLTALGAFRFHWGLRANLVITGEGGAGKSYVVEQVEKATCPGTMFKMSHLTTHAMNGGDDVSGMCMYMEELPLKMFGVDEHGNAIAADPFLKDRLTSAMSVTMSQDVSKEGRDEGGRHARIFVSRLMISHILISNDRLPVKGALMSRFINYTMEKCERTDTGGEDRSGKLSTDVGNCSARVRDVYDGYQLQSYYMLVWESAIESGAMPDIDTSLASITFQWIFEELRSKYNIPMPARRHRDMAVCLARTLTMYYGISAEFFTEMGHVTRHNSYIEDEQIRQSAPPSASSSAAAAAAAASAASMVASAGASADDISSVASRVAAFNSQSFSSSAGPKADRVRFEANMIGGLAKYGVVTQEIAIFVFSLLGFLWVPQIRSRVATAFGLLAGCTSRGHGKKREIIAYKRMVNWRKVDTENDEKPASVLGDEHIAPPRHAGVHENQLHRRRNDVSATMPAGSERDVAFGEGDAGRRPQQSASASASASAVPSSRSAALEAAATAAAAAAAKAYEEAQAAVTAQKEAVEENVGEGTSEGEGGKNTDSTVYALPGTELDYHYVSVRGSSYDEIIQRILARMEDPPSSNDVWRMMDDLRHEIISVYPKKAEGRIDEDGPGRPLHPKKPIFRIVDDEKRSRVDIPAAIWESSDGRSGSRRRQCTIHIALDMVQNRHGDAIQNAIESAMSHMHQKEQDCIVAIPEVREADEIIPYEPNYEKRRTEVDDSIPRAKITETLHQVFTTVKLRKNTRVREIRNSYGRTREEINALISRDARIYTAEEREAIYRAQAPILTVEKNLDHVHLMAYCMKHGIPCLDIADLGMAYQPNATAIMTAVRAKYATAIDCDTSLAVKNYPQDTIAGIDLRRNVLVTGRMEKPVQWDEMSVAVNPCSFYNYGFSTDSLSVAPTTPAKAPSSAAAAAAAAASARSGQGSKRPLDDGKTEVGSETALAESETTALLDKALLANTRLKRARMRV